MQIYQNDKKGLLYFFSAAKNLHKNLSKNLSNRYSKKNLDGDKKITDRCT